MYLTPIKATSATVIGTCQGFPVTAHEKLGEGQVFYFGARLGGSISAGDGQGIELLRAVIWPVVRPAVTGGKLRPRPVGEQHRTLLIVVNDTIDEQTSRIFIPESYSRATDIHADKSIQITGKAID